MLYVDEYLIQALQLYLREFPERGETAQAIREGAALSEISQLAEKEGLHYISAAIFMAEEDRLANIDEPKVSGAIAARIQEIRKHLPDGCKTAAAIDRYVIDETEPPVTTATRAMAPPRSSRVIPVNPPHAEFPT
jgi:hypothetical protein